MVGGLWYRVAVLATSRHGWLDGWRARAADAGALACVALAFVLFFPHVLFGDRFIIAGDAMYYSYPLRTTAWRMIRAGQLPLWTPYTLAGYPLLSMAQVAIGYPLTWGYLFLPGQWAEQVYVLAPFLLAPAFTYAYARELGRSHLAALLAGLSFGYGGMMCGFIANSGMLTNGLMWAPLVLLYVERARTRPFTYSLLRAALAYTMAVLAGHGQSYVYTGLLAAGYGLFLSVSSIYTRRAGKHGDAARTAWTDWRPLLVALGTLVVAAGVAALQLLESLRAARYSIRSALGYEAFGEGSFTPREALLSIGAPLYHYVDTSAYLAPLALLLAAAAIVFAARGLVRDTRLWFWLAVAVVAFLLLLGTNTPLYRLAYRVPVLNQFRVPSRHTFEWTLAVSILAAYGWDAVANRFAQRQRATPRASRFDLPVALTLLAAGVACAALWWRATSRPPAPNLAIYTGLPEKSYWLWKLAFTALVLALAWWCYKLTAPRPRALLLAAFLLLACLAEPLAVVSCWWARQLSLPASRFQLVSPATRYLQQFAPTEGRVYTRVGLFNEEFTRRPRLEAPNLPALYGLHDLAGMEPLILERYSRALGGVGPDSVTPRAGFPAANDDLFAPRSHVLDLLNATHVISYTNLKPFEDALTLRDGIGLAVADLDLTLPPGATAQLPGARGDTSVVALVTSLANSVAVPQDTVVARVRLHTADGQIIERNLRAGVDTAEWAHERADVRAHVKHRLAPVFDNRPGDAAASFKANRYLARLTLDAPQQIEQVEITNVTTDAALAVWKVTLHDEAAPHSAALTQRPARSTLDPARWQTAAEFAGVLVLRNTHALPRAWLVAEAEAVDGEEALRRIRGEGAQDFDPRRTALVEVKPTDLPQLPGGDVAAGSAARVVAYEPSQLTIDTSAPTPTVLVVSENFYPGWMATLDGRPAPILQTDYLLRGMTLPAGQHRVEMRYTAPGARTGALVSALTLCLLAGLAFYARRTRRE